MSARDRLPRALFALAAWIAAGTALRRLWLRRPAARRVRRARPSEGDGRNEAARIIVLLSDGYANRYRSGGSESNPGYSTCSNVNGCAAADGDVLAEALLAAAAGYQIYTIGYSNRAGAALLQARLTSARHLPGDLRAHERHAHRVIGRGATSCRVPAGRGDR